MTRDVNNMEQESALGSAAQQSIPRSAVISIVVPRAKEAVVLPDCTAPFARGSAGVYGRIN